LIQAVRISLHRTSLQVGKNYSSPWEILRNKFTK
jgi:hypothetical protein